MSRRNDNGGSLELLLDTITNTFGGIVFLAMLVALLLRTTSRQTAKGVHSEPPMPAVERATLEVRLAQLEQEVDDLRGLIDSRASAARVTPERIPHSELADAVAALNGALAIKAQASLATLDHQRAESAANDDVKSLEQGRELAEADLADALQRRVAAREEAAELARIALQLDRPPGPTVIEQTVALPTLRSTTKRQLGLYVRYGRIFMMHRWRAGQRLGPNTEQFIVTSGTPPVARPKPQAGILVNPDTIERELLAILKPFSSQGFVVAAVVFDDSFDAFQTIKATLVALGYEYFPIPLKAGESVLDSGGRGAAQ
jgi:hypothetical protein